MSNEERGSFNWIQVAAAALAAMTSAVLLSTLGVAGTIVGAAVGSVAASVASAVYQRGISVSRDHVVAQAVAYSRVSSARADLDDAVRSMNAGDAGDTDAVERVKQAGRELSEAELALQAEKAAAEAEAVSAPAGPDSADPAPGTGIGSSGEAAAAVTALEADSPARRLPWKRIGVVAGGVFLIVMVTITAFELLAGEPLSAITGDSEGAGTTVPGIGGGGDKTPSPTPTPTPTPTESSTPSPSTTPSTTPTPTDSPTADPTDVPTEGPSPDPTAVPSADPTSQATDPGVVIEPDAP